MGKTVSLVRLWKTYLDRTNNGLDEPIPVFIALNEFNHRTNATGDFILSLIAKNYLEDERLKNNLNKLFKARGQRVDGMKVPAVVLLLDGFNEITVEKRELLLGLNHLAEQCLGVQVVITSRYDMRGNFNWGHWNLVRLKELEEDKVEEYLQSKGMAVPKQERLRGLLRNPMMLTLYAASCEVRENQRDSRYCCFKDKVESTGELLWNFIEAQVAKLPEKVGLDEAKVVYYWFLLKYLLPGLGYEIEKAGLFAFTYSQFQESLDHLCRRFSRDDFQDTFLQFGKYEEMLPLGECIDGRDRRKRAARLRDIFCNELHLLVEEGQTLRFLHQDFRDFFAAVHVLNEAEISVRKDEIPGVFKDRILDYFVRRLVGEIEGEHRCKPYLVKDEGWKIDINKENLLHKVLDLCRGKFGEEVGFSVWNIVTIWKEVRGELSGADLSNLDLSKIVLNGVKCSRFYEQSYLVYLSAVFDGSRIHEKNLLPQGHSSSVTSAICCPDGKKILSASGDKTIKEWDARTGACIKTLTGHWFEVRSAVYSPDGKKILSTDLGSIKEWDAATGQCVKTMAGHSRWIRSAVYSPDGKKILSSHDKTTTEWEAEIEKIPAVGNNYHFIPMIYHDALEDIGFSGPFKRWDARLGHCVITKARRSKGIIIEEDIPDKWDVKTGKTLAGHNNFVQIAVYSPDGEKILSSDGDSIKEYDARTGKCLKTLVGHTNCVSSAVYNSDGKKILSASCDNTIKEWDVATGECLKTLAGHTNWVNSAVYSSDGKKILSASSDNTIKEWDVATSECIKILVGHSDIVTSAVYSPDGEKILSASSDHSIKEWCMKTLKCEKIFIGHNSEVNRVMYSPDGKKILTVSDDQNIKEWDTATGECMKNYCFNNLFEGNWHWDGKKLRPALYDLIIKVWYADTGTYLKPHKKSDNPVIHEYRPNNQNIKLRTKGNAIYVPSDGLYARELINIPGLFIQGCSFKNLEKGSEWTKEGLEILRQYNAKVKKLQITKYKLQKKHLTKKKADAE